nr:hypothetical protein [Actinoplanes awajinensis]
MTAMIPAPQHVTSELFRAPAFDDQSVESQAEGRNAETMQRLRHPFAINAPAPRSGAGGYVTCPSWRSWESTSTTPHRSTIWPSAKRKMKVSE